MTERWMLDLSNDELRDRQAELRREMGIIAAIQNHRRFRRPKVIRVGSLSAKILTTLRSAGPLSADQIRRSTRNKYTITALARLCHRGMIARVGPNVFEVLDI